MIGLCNFFLSLLLYNKPMQVYVEDVFIDNFVIDFLLLLLTSRILHLNAKKRLMVLGALIGVLGTVLSLLFSLSGITAILYKIILSAVLVLCITPTTNLKKFFLAHITFITLTFVFGGLITAISLNFGKPIITENGETLYELGLPMGIILGTISLGAFAIIKFIKSLQKRLVQSSFYCTATLFDNDKKIKIRAFIDSGNTLIDPLTQKPVMFISYQSFSKIFQDIPIALVMLKKPVPALKNSHYISLGTITNQKSSALVFTVDKIIIKNDKKTIEIESPTLALTFLNLNKKLDSEMLINPLILGECLWINLLPFC